MSDITDLDAVTLSKAIHEKKLGCSEVMSAYLDRIEKYNPKINAIISMRSREELIKESKLLENKEPTGGFMGYQ